MNFFIFLIFLTMFIIFLNYFFKKNFFLISSTGDRHQKFTSSESIPLSGGIFIFLGILYSYDINFLYFFIFSFLILRLGFFFRFEIDKICNFKTNNANIFSNSFCQYYRS